MISGIIHVLGSSGRWADAPPPRYGPRNTFYNRFVRWAAKRVRSEVFQVMAAASGAPSKACLTARAPLRGRRQSGSRHRPLARRPDDENPPR
ncbi:MAG: hypothetical protein IPK78_10985 [Rhodospirillales bacterium]|nr:hypothetical protein [Rhodospirillales bacterium]